MSCPALGAMALMFAGLALAITACSLLDFLPNGWTWLQAIALLVIDGILILFAVACEKNSGW